MKRVLVAGATGYLGHFAAREFKRRGFHVRALARNESRLVRLLPYVDEVCIGQVTEPATILNISLGMDVVFSSIGITRQRNGFTYRDVDYQGNLNLIEEAKRHNVKKFIYISSFGAQKMPQVKVAAAKQRFVEKLRNSGLKYTIISPNGFFSDMLEVLKMARRGRGYVFGNGEHKVNPIHGADLAEICVDSIESEETDIEVGGPEIFTHKQIYALACQVLGKDPKITSIPVRVRDLLLWILRAFTPEKIYGPLEFFLTAMTMDMVAPTYGHRHLKEFYYKNKALPDTYFPGFEEKR